MSREVGTEGGAMILTLSPLSQQLVLFGVRVSIKDVDEFMGELRSYFEEEMLQAIDAKKVIGPRHVQAAVFHALTTGLRKEFLIRNPSLRILAFLSCERQVDSAVKKVGVNPGSSVEVVVSVVTDDAKNALKSIEKYLSEERGVSPAPELLREPSKERIDSLKRIYQVTDEELRAFKRDGEAESLLDLMIERMSLLSIGL